MYSLQVRNRDYLRISMILGMIWCGGMIVSLFLYDGLINRIIHWQIPLSPKTIARYMYINLPFPMEFHVHIFDIQNPDEVQNGAKPHIKDIGPYVFHEYISKYDVVDNAENDTLTFTMKKTWIFKPELSNGLTGDEMVTTLHPVLNSLALAVNVNRKPLLPMISDAIRIMFNNPATPFWTGRAMDLMFDGFPIDCTSNNFKVKAICSIFEAGENDSIQPVSDDGTEFKFSVLGAYNDSSNGVFKVYRGKKEITDVGAIIEVDNEPEMDAWLTDEENQYRGTDGYFIPPFRTTHGLIWAFERSFCISLGLEYTRKTHDRNLPLRTYRQNFNRFAGDQAYCRDNGSCPVPGTLDLFNCIGAPLIVTLPHFSEAHPSLLDNIESGLHPNKKDHEIFASIDMKTGIPVQSAKRAQISFELVPLAQVDVMKNLPNMVFPFVWFEERFRLPWAYVTLLHLTLILTRRLVMIIKYMCFSVVPLASIASLAIHFLIKHGQITVIDGPKQSNNRHLEIDTNKAINTKNTAVSHGTFIN